MTLRLYRAISALCTLCPPRLGNPCLYSHSTPFAVDERLSEVAGALGRAGIATQWGANALLVYGGRVIVRRYCLQSTAVPPCKQASNTT